MKSVAAVVLLALVATPVRSEDDPKKAAESLQGEWKVVSFNKGGEDTPKEELEKAKFVFVGEKLTITFNNRDETATFTVDPKAKPLAIDITPAGKKEKVVKGIYKLEKDTLSICFGPDGADRPTEFKGTKKSSLIVVERVKK